MWLLIFKPSTCYPKSWSRFRNYYRWQNNMDIYNDISIVKCHIYWNIYWQLFFKIIVLRYFEKFTSSLFIKNESPVKRISSEFCEIYKNTLFIRHIQVTALTFNPNTEKVHNRKISHLNIYYHRLSITKFIK